MLSVHIKERQLQCKQWKTENNRKKERENERTKETENESKRMRENKKRGERRGKGRGKGRGRDGGRGTEKEGGGRRKRGRVEDLDFHNLAFMTECFWGTQYFGTLMR